MSEKYTPSPADKYKRKVNWDHKYRHENMSVDMDVWYPMLKSITFNSYFIPLNYREAEAIISYHLFRRDKDNDYSVEDTKTLLLLQEKIDHYFNTIEDIKKGAMFRLSGRSGKDVEYYDNEKVYNDYLNNLEKLSKKYNIDKNDKNLKYVAMTTLMNRFKVYNGKDCLNVLLTSERLFLDMKDWMLHGGREQIILRKWDDSLCTDREFRAFVQNNELKAICQDERFALFPNVIEKKNLYEKLINDYFNTTLKPLMKIPNYIVDFCILKNNEVKLIEFSPFLRCTSACLFRWDINHEEMLHGNGKLTVKEKEYEYISHFVNDWIKNIKKPSDHFDDYFFDVTDSYYDIFKYYLSYLNPMNIYNYFFNYNNSFYNNRFKNRKIFICSVLKDGFYWSKKYITYDGNKNKFLGKGILNNHCINIDKNGFGWIFPKDGKKCIGEVHEVAYEDFLDVEFFYGQRDTKMEEISVKLIKDNNMEQEIKVFAYVLKEMFDNVKNKEENIVEEYGIDIENDRFNPMQHVINQQERYLNMSLDFDLKDSW